MLDKVVPPQFGKKNVKRKKTKIMKTNEKSLNQMMEQYERIVAMWKEANPNKSFKGQRAHRIGEAKRNDRINRGFSLFTQDRGEQRAIITTL